MALAERVMHAWKEWGIQVLVLLSLTTQTFLRVLAEFRRRFDSGVLRAFVWSAYMMADVAAIYVLGHMSVTSKSPEHRLMAFWAPFLLLHLGGQDNITAYAIEDNRLWLRHLQSFVVQVAAAAYVLYVSSILSSRSSLRPASILMFVAGSAKYGEREWALWRAGSTPSGHKYMSFESSNRVSIPRSQEASGYIAHLLLDIPRDLMNGPLPQLPQIYHLTFHKEVFDVVEMQLSLMHDVLYTKAEVQHSWYGICIRVISSLAIVGAFIIFHRLDDHNNKVDVTVTYILLVGALVLEITSLLMAIFSGWTSFLLMKSRLENLRMGQHNLRVFLEIDRAITWSFRAGVAEFLYPLKVAGYWRRRKYWSGSMGQHNLIQVCSLSGTSRRSKIATWMGLEDRWNTLFYSRTIPVSAHIRDLMIDQVIRNQSDSKLHTVMPSGQMLYARIGFQAEAENIKLDERILRLHIATDIYLRRYKEQHQQPTTTDEPRGVHPSPQFEFDPAKAVEALSNYMLFLLATRHYMLSPTTSRIAYVEACFALTALDYSSTEDLALFLRRWGDSLNSGNQTEVDFRFKNNSSVRRRFTLINSTTLRTGAQLGAKLVARDLEEDPLGVDDSLKVLMEAWVELLFYAACQCSGDSHAKQLSNGGELITIASILVKYTSVHIKITRQLIDIDA